MISFLSNSFLLVILAYIALARTNHGMRMVGGWMPKDVNHEGVKENVIHATNVLNDQSNDAHYGKSIHIHEALSQLVSGVKYNITFDMGKTICRKNEVKATKLSECSLDQKATIKRCKITVWSRPWLNEKTLLHSECTPFLNYPEYFGEKHIAEDQAFHRNKEASFM